MKNIVKNKEEECYENCPSSYGNKYKDEDNWKR